MGVIGNVIGENNTPQILQVSGGTLASVAISAATINQSTITNVSVSGGKIVNVGITSASASGGVIVNAVLNGCSVSAATLNVIAGAGATLVKPGGLLYASVSSSVNATTVETTTMTYALPTSCLVDGKILKIKSWGITANNANAKTIKQYFGTTLMNSMAPAINVAHHWYTESIVICTGPNAQTWQSMGNSDTAADTTITTKLSAGTATEPTSANINIYFTCQGSANTDITQQGMLVEILN